MELKSALTKKRLIVIAAVIVIIAISGPYLKAQAPMLRRRLSHGREARGSEEARGTGKEVR